MRDASSHVYTFGKFTLAASATVTLRSGKGTNTKWTRYWGSTNYIWNNTGDKATLKNAAKTDHRHLQLDVHRRWVQELLTYRLRTSLGRSHTTSRPWTGGRSITRT